ncbi:MAG: hypothetical protein J7621_12680 [Niastella sp.]|nr:hypothetical protein [Niastella sp.]
MDTLLRDYAGDELRDVNWDGHIDYVASSYSGAGCCPRDEKVAYLYNEQTGDFYPAFFFNPEFNDAEKVVYNTNYASPGQLVIDKSRWEGLDLVLVESIYPTLVANSLDVVAKPYTFTRITYPDKKEQIIKDVPEEYKKLKIYEYFISYQE